jgi:NAD-dependent deacetylase
MEPILYDAFLTSEAARLEDWRRRFDMAARFRAAEPNAAHRAVARYVEMGRVALVVTQNIDGLHARSGVPADRLVELHGTSAYARCLDCGARHELSHAQDAIAKTGMSPRCTSCGGLLKAAVVSFGEAMPVEALHRAMSAAVEADLFLALGTSLPQLAAEAGAALVICSQAPTDQDGAAELVVRTPLAATFAPLLD